MKFASSPAPTLGVELEVNLVDRTTGALVPHGPEVRKLASRMRPDLESRLQKELKRSIVEVVTGVNGTVAEAMRDLGETFAVLQEAAAQYDCQVISSGLHPFDSWRKQQITPNPRYEMLAAARGLPLRRMVSTGMHVHVGVSGGDAAVNAMHVLAAHIPHFLALSASSPYWAGEETGLESYRVKVFAELPTTGPPDPQLRNWSQYAAMLKQLQDAGCIESAHSTWPDVRPSEGYGTVENRACDGVSTLVEASAIVALTQCLVVRSDRLGGGRPEEHPFWLLEQNKQNAAERGVGAMLLLPGGGHMPLADSLRTMVEELHPIAESLRCSDELERIIPMLDVWGSSARRQRQFVARGGSVKQLPAALASEFSTGVPGVALGRAGLAVSPPAVEGPGDLAV
jgi:carboxylate-amine ligase